MYGRIVAEARGDDDIHVLTNMIGVGDVEVSAFQTSSDVVIQKSIREGFGLGVSETMWKATPVVANRAGGIPLQMEGDVGGFLVDSTEECAEPGAVTSCAIATRPESGARPVGRGCASAFSSPGCSPMRCDCCWTSLQGRGLTVPSAGGCSGHGPLCAV